MEEPVVNPINFRDSEAHIGLNEICIEPVDIPLSVTIVGQSR